MDVDERVVYLAGGCFWGTEAFVRRLPGVVATQVGYANGNGSNPSPSYEEVCSGATGCAETVRVEYDPATISLALLLEAFLTTIDPTSVNRQGADAGTQYRTGIWWEDPADERVVRGCLTRVARELPLGSAPVAVEAGPLRDFWPAEGYHQGYLEANPGGYCHVDLGGAARFVAAHEADFAIVREGYERAGEGALRERLDDLGWAVTQESATEAPHSSPLDQDFRHGIYVDRASGEPLFSSADKFDAGCGWPSFARPIARSQIMEYEDHRMSRPRTEVRSAVGDSHLGHVFADGPEELGGLRYCINGAALEFVPLEEMDARGYGYLKGLVE